MGRGRQFARVYVTVIAALGAVFLFSTQQLAASEPESSVILSELMWDGTEYIELYNLSTDDVALEEWYLTRQQEDGDAKTIYTFDEEDIIEAESYFLIEKNESATEVAADVITSSLTLVNSGELVTLYDDTDAVVDQANQLSEWFAGENTTDGVSMERTDVEEDGTLEESWHTSTSLVGGRHGTPGEANSEPAVNTAPEAVIDGPTNGSTNESLTFSGEDSSDIDEDELSYSWTLGDRTTATGSEVTHTYMSAGTYTVTLAVDDGELEDEETHSVTISKPTYSDAVRISEFLPNPAGSDTSTEFIELYNSDSSSVDLSGWQLDDVDGGSSPYTIPDDTSISGKGYKSFSRSDTKIALNNSGDSVRLIDPNGDVKSIATYSSTAPEAQSFVEDDGEYVLTTTVTDGSANTVTKPEEDEEEDEDNESSDEDEVDGSVAGTSTEVVPLTEVRDQEIGAEVTTRGVVSVPPGIFGEYTVYIAGSGIQLYSSKKWPTLALGDTVELTGELSAIRGEARLKLAQTSDISVVSSGEPPAPHVVATGDIDEQLEGTLVTVQGKVVQTSGDTFYVDDDSGEVKVFIKNATGIDKPKMQKGTNVTITGVVSETTSGYRILPRFQEDVRLGLVAGLTSFPATGLGHISSNQLSLIWLLTAIIFILAARAREPLLHP